MALAGYQLYQTGQEKKAAEEKARVQAEFEAKILKPFSDRIADWLDYTPDDIDDSFAIEELNLELPHDDEETMVEVDEEDKVLYIDYLADSTNFDEELLPRTLYYNSVVNFILLPDLQQIIYYFKDETVTINRGELANQIGVEFADLDEQSAWQQLVYSKLLDEAYMLSFMEDVARVEDKGLPAFEDIKENAVLALYVRQTFGIESFISDPMDIDVSKAIVKQLKGVYTKYPQLYNYVFEIKCTDKVIENRYMEMRPAISFDSGTININEYWYSNVEKMNKSIRSDLNSDYFPKTTTDDSVIAHELGHVMEAYVVRYTFENNADRGEAWKDSKVSTEIISAAYTKIKPQLAAGTSKKGALEAISGYALDGGNSEALAEAFQDVYTNGDQANIMSIAMIQELNRILAEIDTKKTKVE